MLLPLCLSHPLRLFRQCFSTFSLHETLWKAPVCEVSWLLLATCFSLSDSKSFLFLSMSHSQVTGFNLLWASTQLKMKLVCGISPLSPLGPGSCSAHQLPCLNHWERPEFTSFAPWQKVHRHRERIIGGVRGCRETNQGDI